MCSCTQRFEEDWFCIHWFWGNLIFLPSIFVQKCILSFVFLANMKICTHSSGMLTRALWIYIRSRSIKEKKAKILVAIVEFYITAMPLDLAVNVKRSEHTELDWKKYVWLNNFFIFLHIFFYSYLQVWYWKHMIWTKKLQGHPSCRSRLMGPLELLTWSWWNA